MLSTVLVILDGYPRSITVLILRLRGPEQKADNIMDRSNFLLFTGHAGAGCRGGMRAVVPIDFLVLKNNKPWFPVEVKLNQDWLSENWRAFLPDIKCNRAVQVVNQTDTFNIIRQGDCNILIISAEEFLRYLI
jgi:hypothetical protein